MCQVLGRNSLLDQDRLVVNATEPEGQLLADSGRQLSVRGRCRSGKYEVLLGVLKQQPALVKAHRRCARSEMKLHPFKLSATGCCP